MISIDGTKDIHNKLRGVGKKFDTWNRILKSVDVLRKYDIPLRINTCITDDTISSLDEIAEAVAEIAPEADHKFNFEFDHHKNYPHNYPQDINHLEKVKKHMYTNAFYKVIGQNNYTGHGCLAGITRCIILPEGTVEACTQSRRLGHYVLGNLKEYDFDFDALWVSEQARRMRAEIPGCVGCSVECDRG